jgi:DNA-binding NarL/FixJ family response regulator
LHESDPSPFQRARTELCYGERLRRARRRADARERLHSALATFDRLGARPWAKRARLELQATGEPAPAPEWGAAKDLTPHELQVALTAARGKTNRETAAELFVSPKTIEAHLHRIYVKLGLRSRT